VAKEIFSLVHKGRERERERRERGDKERGRERDIKKERE